MKLFYLGLPVALSSLETRLLLEQGIARLISKKLSLLREPTANELLEYQLKEEEDAKAHIEAYRQMKVENAEHNLDAILASKRKKLLEKGVPEEGLCD